MHIFRLFGYTGSFAFWCTTRLYTYRRHNRLIIHFYERCFAPFSRNFHASSLSLFSPIRLCDCCVFPNPPFRCLLFFLASYFSSVVFLFNFRSSFSFLFPYLGMLSQLAVDYKAVVIICLIFVTHPFFMSCSSSNSTGASSMIEAFSNASHDDLGEISDFRTVRLRDTAVGTLTTWSSGCTRVGTERLSRFFIILKQAVHTPAVLKNLGMSVP